MLQSKEEKEKKYKDESRNNTDTSNSSFSKNQNHANGKNNNSLPSDDFSFGDAEQKIDELLNKTKNDFSEKENDNQLFQKQESESMTPEVKITSPEPEQNDKTAASENKNPEKNSSVQNHKEELFEIQRSNQAKKKELHQIDRKTKSSKQQVKAKKSSISFPKIHVNIKGKEQKKKVKNHPQRKKKGFFDNISFFNKKSKEKTMNEKEMPSSTSSFAEPSKQNQHIVKKPQSLEKNQVVKEGQKPQKENKKKFSFFSSKKKKEPKKPSSQMRNQDYRKTDMKKEKQPNEEKIAEQDISQSDNNMSASDNEGSFIQHSLNDDVKRVLSITDELLAQLPDHVIEDFASSEDFQLYQKVMNKYQIK